MIGNEAVHFRPQDKGLADGGADQMKIGIFIFGPAGVLFGQIGVQGAQINLQIDVGFVVSPIGVEVGRELRHARQLPQPPAVLPVAAPCFPFFQVSSLQFVKLLR